MSLQPRDNCAPPRTFAVHACRRVASGGAARTKTGQARPPGVGVCRLYVGGRFLGARDSALGVVQVRLEWCLASGCQGGYWWLESQFGGHAPAVTGRLVGRWGLGTNLGYEEPRGVIHGAGLEGPPSPFCSVAFAAFPVPSCVECSLAVGAIGAKSWVHTFTF